jgi:LysM repeat protein
MASDTKQLINKSIRKKLIDTSQKYIEGVMTVLPNPNYRAKTVYCARGLGNLFNGDYYFLRVRHTLGATYTVEADVEEVSVSSPSTVKKKNTVSKTPISTSGNYLVITVKSGDTLSRLASKYHTTISQLAKINHILNVNHIYKGQKLKVPRR